MSDRAAKPARIRPMAVDRPPARPPEFPPVEWLNTAVPLTLEGLLGQVVLLHFFDFTSPRCLRQLPVLRDWHRRYQQASLVTLGIHAAAFPFARDRAAVQRALGRLGIRWPVALDNQQEISTAFANRLLPAVHLIDRAGLLRSSLGGEAGDPAVETALRTLLEDGISPESGLPQRSPSEGVVTGGALMPVTPGLNVESIGNGSAQEDRASHFVLPDSRLEGAFYLDGEWRLRRRGWTLESDEGEIALPFQASAVHAVLAARPDDPIGDKGEPAWLEALLDRERVEPGHFGQDLLVRQQRTCLGVDAARSYSILQSLPAGLHELRLRCASPGTTVYAFAFEPDREPEPAPRSELC